jgi:uncharacterized protein (TIGR03083 family)
MADDSVGRAFQAEARSLSAAMVAVPAGALDRPSPCPPWTAAELFSHVRVAVGRLLPMLAAPELTGDGSLVSAAGYYQPDHRFSAATNADRIATAQRGAAELDATSLVAEFGRVWHEAWTLVEAASPGRVVRTRHGDLMLLTEFLRTRVLELAVHGLDLATALGQPPWLTPEAATVVEDLALPRGTAAELGWPHATLVAAITGRRDLTPAERTALEDHHLRRLALG